MNQSFLYDCNMVMTPLLSLQSWTLIEMACGVLLFFICMFQRVYSTSFKTSGHNFSYWAVKIGQIGIWAQMMLGLLTIIDGYDTYYTGNVHTLLILWCLSSVLVKSNIFMTAFEKGLAV